jgi:hypothetical protein
VTRTLEGRGQTTGTAAVVRAGAVVLAFAEVRVAGFEAQLRLVVVGAVALGAVADDRFRTRYQTIALSRDSSRMNTTAGMGRRTDVAAMDVRPPCQRFIGGLERR